MAFNEKDRRPLKKDRKFKQALTKSIGIHMKRIGHPFKQVLNKGLERRG